MILVFLIISRNLLIQVNLVKIVILVNMGILMVLVNSGDSCKLGYAVGVFAIPANLVFLVNLVILVNQATLVNLVILVNLIIL